VGAYTEYRKALSPPWLRRPRGEAWNEALGEVEDGLLSRFVRSLKARHPGFAPEEMLALIGADRQLVRGPGETTQSYATRLRNAIGAWRWAGTAKGLLEYGLAPLGYTSVRIITHREWPSLADGGRVPDGQTERWARFWIACGRPPVIEARTWSEMETLGFRDSDTWGTRATRSQVHLLKRVIDQWRPANARCMGVWEVLGDVATLTFDATPDDANWREESVTFDGGVPAVFWRFSPPIQAVP
jgi:hypothetical protein